MRGHFTTRIKTQLPTAYELPLNEFDWPGNPRVLQALNDLEDAALVKTDGRRCWDAFLEPTQYKAPSPLCTDPQSYTPFIKATVECYIMQFTEKAVLPSSIDTFITDCIAGLQAGASREDRRLVFLSRVNELARKRGTHREHNVQDADRPAPTSVILQLVREQQQHAEPQWSPSPAQMDADFADLLPPVDLEPNVGDDLPPI